MKKVCTVCKKNKPLTEYHKGRGTYGLKPDCKECVKNASRTKLRVLIDSFNHQVRNSIKRNYEPPSYTKDELIEWAMGNPTFHKLYMEWKESGYKTQLKPSIDRIDDYKSYSINNIQIATFSKNQQNYYLNTIEGNTTKKSLAIDQLSLDGKFIKRFPSIQLAGRELGIAPINIQRCCSGKPIPFKRNGRNMTRIQKTAGGFKWRYSLVPNNNSEKR